MPTPSMRRLWPFFGTSALRMAAGAALVLAGMFSLSAQAAEHAFSFRSDGLGLTLSQGSFGNAAYEQGTLGLLDSVSNLPLTASFTAAVDDTISVMVMLDGPLTVPPWFGSPDNQANQVSIRLGGVEGTVIFADQILSFFLDSVEVDGAGLVPWGGSGNELIVGGYDQAPGTGLTFNQVHFSARINSIHDSTLGQWTDNILVTSLQPTLIYRVFAPVSEPSSASLLLCALGLLGLRAGRGRRA